MTRLYLQNIKNLLCYNKIYSKTKFNYLEEFMGEKVINFKNGVALEFGQGKFDGWCVYITDEDGKRSAPKDMDYFAELKELSYKYGAEQIYKDFISFYDITGKELDAKVFDSISNLSSYYGDNSIDIEILFSILYMGMLAEENKEKSVLGKRIKRLGLYTLLIEDKPVDHSANFMNGKKCGVLDKLCKERGF